MERPNHQNLDADPEEHEVLYADRGEHHSEEDRPSRAQSVMTVSEHSVDKDTGKKKEILKSCRRMAFFNMFRALVGSTILAVPYACANLGIIPFTIMTVCILCFVFHGMDLLLKVADDLPYTGASYEQLIRKVLHKKWAVLLAQVMLVLLQIFKVVGHNIFIVQTLEHIMCKEIKSQYCMPRPYYVVISFLFSAPSYLVMNISFYSYISLASVVSVISLILCLDFSSIYMLQAKGPAIESSPNFYKLPLFFSLVTHSLNGIGLAMPIRASLQDTSEFPKVSQFTTVFVFVIYYSSSVLASLALGKDMTQISPLGFPLLSYKPLLIMLVIFSIIVFVTYPLHLFPVYTIALNSETAKVYLDKAEDAEDKSRRTKRILYGARAFCLIAVYSIVITAPDFVSFLGMIGAVFATTFLYVFPVFLYNVHFKNKGELSRRTEISNYIFMGLMVAMALVSTADSLSNMFKSTPPNLPNMGTT
jgi:amino acid permease